MSLVRRSLVRRSLVLASALALAAVAAHADTFAGTAAFQDNGPAGNGLNYTGVFSNPTFSFTGGVGTTYTDTLTITAQQRNATTASDNISVQLTFSLPGAAADTINGTGTNSFSFFGLIEDNNINWTNNTSLINFTNGSQLMATIPDFLFSGSSFNTTASASEDLTLKVTKTAVTPEPSSLALLGTGLVGTCGAIRRRFTR